jgi:hypothetical protein
MNRTVLVLTILYLLIKRIIKMIMMMTTRTPRLMNIRGSSPTRCHPIHPRGKRGRLLSLRLGSATASTR